MAKLPFVVQPRLKPIMEMIGSEESGKFEIERRGFLNVAEKSFVQAAVGSDSALADLHQLAAKISRKTQIPTTDIFQMLVGNMPDKKNLLEPFEGEISEALTGLMAYQEKHRLAIAACMLMNRIDPSLTVEDALKLHPDIVDGLNALYNDEEAKNIEALEAAMADDKPKTEAGKE